MLPFRLFLTKPSGWGNNRWAEAHINSIALLLPPQPKGWGYGMQSSFFNTGGCSLKNEHPGTGTPMRDR